MMAPMTPAAKPITQNADIRYLGKLLGDVIRAYGGVELFERIEYIRARSVDRHRGLSDAAAIVSELKPDNALALRQRNRRGLQRFDRLA